MPVMGDLGIKAQAFSDTDYGVTGLFLGSLANVGGQITAIAGNYRCLAVLIGLTVATKGKNQKAASE